MSSNVSLAVGRTYAAANGAFFTIERIELLNGSVLVKHYDALKERWLRWDVDLRSLVDLIAHKKLKRRKKPAINESGGFFWELPAGVRPGKYAEALDAKWRPVMLGTEEQEINP